MPFAATWMDLEIIILSEVSQKEKGKYHMISFMWTQMKLSMKQTHRLVVAKVGLGEGWIGSLG